MSIRFTSTKRGVLGQAIAMGLLTWAGCVATAQAQTVAALQDASCAGTRAAANLGCTAGEFTVAASFTATAGSPTTCVSGSYVTVGLDLNLSGSNAQRDDIGFFIGQDGNDPKVNNAAGMCSVATFPNSGTIPWNDDDGDTCGDLPKTQSPQPAATPSVTGIKLLCKPDPTTGKLQVPYVMTYWQNTGNVCGGPADVVPGSTSKCNTSAAGTVATVTNIAVTGYLNITKQTNPDGAPDSFAFTASGTGAGGVAAAPASFNLTDGQTQQVTLPIEGTAHALTVQETAAFGWGPDATIVCTAPGGGAAAYIAVDNINRTITANLDTTNVGGDCTITNTRQPANLSLVKSGPSSVTPGAPISYTLVISNAGPGPADGASYSDTVPGAITGVTASCGNPTGSAACANPSVVGNTVTGTVPTLPAGGSVTITIDGTVSPGATGTIANSATVSPPAGVTDPDPVDNTGSTSTSTPVTLQKFDVSQVPAEPKHVARRLPH